ncbi:endoribonuclease [Heterostelium album PN500]|uniref:Endoribonuclease n=1 Tax=Heterostelium pallidum (strain ATCC 26659 / Pp 5 / PN500) TaxID=670386 RepID=D3AWF8_HETP5|nr:endoribonuclease [Heterostelium album PN500]EFA86631.1 endoribonuclease [Heterostelium album PN500]|eukprot:XP_020438736.1 endoribonuclease [Heterostelium album PN500]
MSVYEKLKELNIELGKPSTNVAAYVMAAQTGNTVFLSGHIARRSDGTVWVGKCGANINTDEGKDAARSIAVDLITTLHSHTGDLNKIKRIVKVMGLVNSTLEFTEHHLVMNGCSELLNQVFGEVGRHARSAFGVAQIPLGACVEIEMIVEVC